MAHNNFRKIHHAGPLTLDAGLSNQAQLYAEYLAQQAGGLVHSSQALRPGEAPCTSRALCADTHACQMGLGCS